MPANPTNKLAYITDQVSSGNYTEDIDNQTSFNYTYDPIGNLVSECARRNSKHRLDSVRAKLYFVVEYPLRRSPSDEGLFLRGVISGKLSLQETMP